MGGNPKSKLARALENAVVLGESKGDVAQAMRILDSNLRDDASDEDRVQALVYRAELAERAGDDATLARIRREPWRPRRTPCLLAGVQVVVGSSGLTAADYDRLDQLACDTGVGFVYAWLVAKVWSGAVWAAIGFGKRSYSGPNAPNGHGIHHYYFGVLRWPPRSMANRRGRCSSMRS
jgi:hypothetical protein